MNILGKFGYDKLPSNYLNDNISSLKNIMSDVDIVKKEIFDTLKKKTNMSTELIGYQTLEPTSKKPHKNTLDDIDSYNALSIYYTNLSKVLEYKTKTGKGINIFNDPYNIIKRLELLAASINAGNNGVIPEFSKLAHHLKQTNVISNKQLNDLLKTYLTNI